MWILLNWRTFDIFGIWCHISLILNINAKQFLARWRNFLVAIFNKTLLIEICLIFHHFNVLFFNVLKFKKKLSHNVQLLLCKSLTDGRTGLFSHKVAPLLKTSLFYFSKVMQYWQKNCSTSLPTFLASKWKIMNNFEYR